MSQLVSIKSFPTRNEAELARSILEANGIKAVVSADDAGGMRPEIGFTTGGASLLVLDEKAEQALKLLEQV